MNSNVMTICFLCLMLNCFGLLFTLVVSGLDKKGPVYMQTVSTMQNKKQI